MSSQEIALNAGNMAIIHTDLSKIFLRDNRHSKSNHLNNGAYNPLTLLAGTVMGRVGTSGKVVPFFSLATDGSQFPIGVLAHDVEIDSGDTKEVTICDGGDVASDKVVFYYNGDALTTVVSSRQVKDYLHAMGVRLITVNEMTQEDND